jgi:hypothetical protein
VHGDAAGPQAVGNRPPDGRSWEHAPGECLGALRPGRVRVITSADGRVVWVTARGSNALLGFAADRLRTDPARALLAGVQVATVLAVEQKATGVFNIVDDEPAPSANGCPTWPRARGPSGRCGSPHGWAGCWPANRRSR